MNGIGHVAALVAVILALAACDLSERPAATSVQPTAAITATSHPETAAPMSAAPPIDLASIIVSPEAPPPGMHHDETGLGRDALTMLIISGREAEFAALNGFVDARWTTFSGDAGALLSLAMAFEEGIVGDVTYHEFVNELRSEEGYGFGDVERVALGFEGICDTGANPAHDGLVETICIWREANLILIAGGPMPPAALKAIAADMDARLP
jgi:hypothetical protein